ncbi:PDLI1 protein, partial [Sylvia borin]|nr:PDLI1 protein [Sylvia borin]
MPVTVTLPGPAPWGFRISGGRDFRKPITVSKVGAHGKAATGDLRPGDVIVTINGESTAEMLHVEAQNKIKQSPVQLRLEVERWPGEAKPVWEGPAPLPEHWGVGRAGTQGPAHPRRCRRPPRRWGTPAVGWRCPGGAGCLLHPRAESQDARGRPIPPCGQPLAPGLASPSIPPSLAFSFSCFSSPNWEAPRPRARPFPAAFGRSPGRPLAPPAARSFLPPQLLVCFGAGSEGSPPAPEGPPQLGHPRHRAGDMRMPRCPHPRRTQAVRIQEGRYRHPSCYTCADCGLSLKMRGHFWVGDELFCEKHARLRYQGPPGAPVPRPAS